MDYYKKQRIKDHFKKNKKAYIWTGAFAGAALVVMLIGFAMSGWDLIKWLKSQWATTFFIMLILGGFGLFFFLFILKKLKEFFGKDK